MSALSSLKRHYGLPFHQIIDSRICTEQLRRRTLRSLRKTCGSRRILPRSHYFPGKLSKASNRALAGGGTADVWRVTDDRERLYAAKVFRVYQGEDYRIKVSASHQVRPHDSLSSQRYYKEVTAWKRLNHPNVVPTLGAGLDIAELCVVSPWMDGDLLQHLNRYPGANRVAIVRVYVFPRW